MTVICAACANEYDWNTPDDRCPACSILTTTGGPAEQPAQGHLGRKANSLDAAATNRLTTKDARWRAKQRMLGRCTTCGVPVSHGALCDKHRERLNARGRAYRARKREERNCDGTQHERDGARDAVRPDPAPSGTDGAGRGDDADAG